MVMFITMPLTVQVLMKMGRAGDGVNCSADASLRMATIYILVICFIAILTLLPMFFPTMFLHDGYCALNIVIYGAMNRQYREVFRTVYSVSDHLIFPNLALKSQLEFKQLSEFI